MKYLALPLLLAASPALAQSTPDLIQAEILPGWRTESGTHMAALHLRLAPEWKTYWRAPGDAGLPPRFDWSGSENLAGVTVHWPRPQVFDLNGMMTIGYLQDVVLPIELTATDPDQPITLDAEIDLGICRDVCVPASLALQAALPFAGGADSAISQALARRPLTGPEAGLTALDCTVEALPDGLRVTARFTLPDMGQTLGAAETVVIEPAEDHIWVSDAAVTRQGAILTAAADLVPNDGKPFALNQDSLRLTVLDGDDAVEVTGCPKR